MKPKQILLVQDDLSLDEMLSTFMQLAKEFEIVDKTNFHPWTRQQWRLLEYYVDLGLTHAQADAIMWTAWVYDDLDKQLP